LGISHVLPKCIDRTAGPIVGAEHTTPHQRHTHEAGRILSVEGLLCI
jgi:hypothetical protein